jgi:hypothetical protein
VADKETSCYQYEPESKKSILTVSRERNFFHRHTYVSFMPLALTKSLISCLVSAGSRFRRDCFQSSKSKYDAYVNGT